MRSSEIQLRKLKLRLRDKRFANHKAPCTAIWQQPLQSVMALRGCSATDLILIFLMPLVQQVRGSIPGGVVNFNIKKIFNLGARRGGDVHFLIARLYVTVLD